MIIVHFDVKLNDKRRSLLILTTRTVFAISYHVFTTVLQLSLQISLQLSLQTVFTIKYLTTVFTMPWQKWLFTLFCFRSLSWKSVLHSFYQKYLWNIQESSFSLISLHTVRQYCMKTESGLTFSNISSYANLNSRTKC